MRNVPVWLLKGTRSILRSFQWASDAADRLAFAEVLSSNESFDADMAETYRVLGVDPASITPLEAYLQVRGSWRRAGCGPCTGAPPPAAGAGLRREGPQAFPIPPSRPDVPTPPHPTPHHQPPPLPQAYFDTIIKKLKDLGASSKQTNFCEHRTAAAWPAGRVPLVLFECHWYCLRVSCAARYHLLPGCPCSAWSDRSAPRAPPPVRRHLIWLPVEAESGAIRLPAPFPRLCVCPVPLSSNSLTS